jgi:hypothetical protein
MTSKFKKSQTLNILEVFKILTSFSSTPEENNRDESGAELVHELGSMVSLGKMILVNRPLRLHIVRSDLNTSKITPAES